MLEAMRDRAKTLLNTGEVTEILAWREGEGLPEPAFFTDDLDDMVYNRFCTANLSRLLIGTAGGRTLVFLRPCDAYSFEQLVQERQIKREVCYVIGIGCEGLAASSGDDELHELCRTCTKTDHPVHDELIGADIATRATTDENARFAEVERLEDKTPDERYEFWQRHLARCIRCYACRNICPTCHCKSCVFDTLALRQKANVTNFEGQMYHITRAYHQAERCTDCGQCSRVCPQKIPLYLLSRKHIRDVAAYVEPGVS